MYYLIVPIYINDQYLNISYQSEHVCRKENMYLMYCFMESNVFEFEFEFELKYA